MDIETENIEDNNSKLYKYSESGLKLRNYNLWEEITSIELDITFKEKFYLYENKMEKCPICYCGNELKFIDMINGYRQFCCRRCMLDSDEIKEQKKKTCIEKYGVDNPSKSLDIKNLVKITNNKKYGVDHPLQSLDFVEKNKKYFMEKFGVDNPSKLPEIREKANITIKEKYGVDHIMFSDEIKEKNKKYFMEKFGVDNPSKLPEIREKARFTNNLRYGVDHALQNQIFLEKLKTTNNLRYGFYYASQSPLFKEKTKLTNNLLYGVDYISQNLNIKEKVKLTNVLKYGHDSYSKTDEFKKRFKDLTFIKNSTIVNNSIYNLVKSEEYEYTIECNVCNKYFKIQRQLYKDRIKNGVEVCLNCNPIVNGVSVDEKKVFSFIKENYNGVIIENYRYEKKEIDVYLPDLKIGFEYNGLYWHSELNKSKSYHYDKYEFFKEKEISVINIWEDDWIYKQDIVKSMILNKLGKSNRIFARKTVVRIVEDNKNIREFLENNHIQGFIGSKIKIGLYYNNELVSLMTLGSLRKPLGQTSKDGSYELLRFCNKLNTTVVGGSSKLLNYFLNNYDVKEIISYSLNSYSSGDLYKKLGFDLISETKSNYFWVKNTIRYHRFNFRKDKLVKEGYDSSLTEVEIMHNRGYFRVFDSGSKKWIKKSQTI
jgi:hypothetical protein